MNMCIYVTLYCDFYVYIFMSLGIYAFLTERSICDTGRPSVVCNVVAP